MEFSRRALSDKVAVKGAEITVCPLERARPGVGLAVRGRNEGRIFIHKITQATVLR